ncbi:MAG: hypothetical protein QW682_08090 [Nitrososphaerota archaeon]
MFSIEEVSKLILDIRSSLGLQPYVKPRIDGLVYDEKSNYVLIIAHDRPDKAAIIGMGGRILYELAKKLNVKHASITTTVDINIKKERILEAIRTLKEKANSLTPIQYKIVKERFIPLLENELKYPHREILEMGKFDEEEKVAIAYSGGVDSTTALILMNNIGLKPIALTINPGNWMITKETKKIIEKITNDLRVRRVFIECSEEFKDIFQKASEGKLHPCGRCRKKKDEIIISWAKENNVEIVVSGDLLPTGHFSVHFINGIMRFNIAALALNKTSTILIAKEYGHPGTKFIFGCPFLVSLHRKYEHLKIPSIYRVLRETRANILEPMQALKYIRSIVGI